MLTFVTSLGCVIFWSLEIIINKIIISLFPLHAETILEMTFFSSGKDRFAKIYKRIPVCGKLYGRK